MPMKQYWKFSTNQGEKRPPTPICGFIERLATPTATWFCTITRRDDLGLLRKNIYLASVDIYTQMAMLGIISWSQMFSCVGVGLMQGGNLMRR